MKTYRDERIYFIGAMAVMLLGGCVSTSKYKKLEEDKNKEISGLQQQITTLEQSKASVEQSKADLEKQNADLAAQKAYIEKSNAQAEQQYNELLGKLADEVHDG